MQDRRRIIPCLTMQHLDLVKTVGFKNPRYIGDPINAVRIFSEKGVDELCLLDITATKEHRAPDIPFLHEIAGEAFIPLGYGGGIRTVDQAREIIRMGFEKVIINSLLFEDPDEVRRIIDFAGEQSVVASIDYRYNILGKAYVVTHCGCDKTGMTVLEALKYAERIGVGEILLTSINAEGSMKGYDLKCIKEIEDKANVPVIANGGAGGVEDIKRAFDAGADAVSASSMFVYYGKNKAVLINTLDSFACI